jgi:predicted DNA-binding transcriptional regulator AlpA
MLTQDQIAKRVGRSLSAIRHSARKSDFPPPRRVGGPNNRVKFYAASEVDMWWKDRVDGRGRYPRKKRRSR